MTEMKELERKFLLDLPNGRYDTVALTWAWLNVLQKTDEAKGLSPSELVKKALDDVMTGGITFENVKNAKSKVKSAPEPEEKSEEEHTEKEPKKKNEKKSKK
jgi:hypothetical protein